MKKILIFLLVFLNNLVLAGDNYLYEHTGNAKGININVSETYTITAGNDALSEVIFKFYHTESCEILHNKQTISDFNIVYSRDPNSTSENTDSYGNTFTEAKFIDLEANGSISYTSNYNAETEVNIPGFKKPNDNYPLNTSGLSNDIAQYLNATDNVQSDNSNIKTQAESIVNGCTKTYDAVLELSKWVRGNISFDASDNPQDALSVYNNRKGKCFGFVHLMIAFLRSIGIPARYCECINLKKSFGMPIQSGTLTVGNTGNTLHSIYQIYYPSLSNWAAGDPQESFSYITTNAVIKAYGREKDDCDFEITYYPGTSAASLSISITANLKQISPCNYEYQGQTIFSGSNSGERLLSAYLINELRINYFVKLE